MATKVRETQLTPEQEAKAPIYDLGSVPKDVEVKVEEAEEKGEAALPSAPTVASVEEIGRLVKDPSTHKALERAHKKLSHGHRETTIDWDTTLYVLIAAWIVNFGRDSEDITTQGESTIEVPDLTDGVPYVRQTDNFVHLAAAEVNLKWIPFVDLALAPFSSNPKPASGPYGGVFVHEGAEPFLILAFKGTTFGYEVTTDALASAVRVNTPAGALYGALTHQGMAQGLFSPFTHVGYSKPAFDLILERLDVVAKSLNRPNIPVYVTGHSLGAGYATQAFVELIRRHTPTRAFQIHDMYIYGSPRMFNKGSDKLGIIPAVIGIREVEAEIAKANLKVWRVANYKDLVPNFPRAVLHTYKHLDVGFKTFPAPEDADKLVDERPSEVPLDAAWDNDGWPGALNSAESWTWHWPVHYYNSILKVIKHHHKI